MKFSAATSARNARRPGHRMPRAEVTREIIGHVLSPALLYPRRSEKVTPLSVRQPPSESRWQFGLS